MSCLWVYPFKLVTIQLELTAIPIIIGLMKIFLGFAFFGLLLFLDHLLFLGGSLALILCIYHLPPNALIIVCFFYHPFFGRSDEGMFLITHSSLFIYHNLVIIIVFKSLKPIINEDYILTKLDKRSFIWNNWHWCSTATNCILLYKSTAHINSYLSFWSVLKISLNLWPFNCEKMLVLYYVHLSIHWWPCTSMSKLRCLMFSIIRDKSTFCNTTWITKGVIALSNHSFFELVCHSSITIVSFDANIICTELLVIPKAYLKHTKQF